jgi:hypothetical protein
MQNFKTESGEAKHWVTSMVRFHPGDLRPRPSMAGQPKVKLGKPGALVLAGAL